MAPGTYADDFIRIDATTTSALELSLHGGGASLIGESSEYLIQSSLPLTIRNLQISYPGTAVMLTRPSLLERVRITANIGVVTSSQVTIRDAEIESTSSEAIYLSNGRLSLDRTILRGGARGISTSTAGTTTVEISNLLAYGQSDVAIDLTAADGYVEFSTIAGVGAGGTSGIRGVRCPPTNTVTLRSTIVWTASGAPVNEYCRLVDVIAGPMSVAGASNANPMFIDGYHLGPNSPARDAVDVGPAFDYEGDPRPKGTRFDIGADEAD